MFLRRKIYKGIIVSELQKKLEIFICSRKSKWTGKGESVENQIAMCQDYIKYNNEAMELLNLNYQMTKPKGSVYLISDKNLE